MKWFKNKKEMDERELMEEYRIEHWMFWLMYIGLAVSIVIQTLFMGRGASYIEGEAILLLVTAVITVVLQIRKGQYDGGFSEPGWKSYLFYALVFSAASTVLVLIRGCMAGWYEGLGDLAAVGAVMGGSLFVLLYGVLALMGTITKHRRKRLAEKYDEE